MTPKKFNEAYANANTLQINSKFTYVGVDYIVLGFTSTKIIAKEEISGKIDRFSPFDFEGAIYYGFLQIK